MTKIGIISGLLEADKATLIKELLEEVIVRGQVVLTEDEFGETGINNGFLKDLDIEIRGMNPGCICCSLAGDFGTFLAEVLTQYKPERVIIEPSSVSKLSGVMGVATDASADMDVELNSAVTIVNMAKCEMYIKNFGEFFNNRIENTGTIILSRTDITGASKIQKDVNMIHEENANAVVITTPLDQLGGSRLLKIIEKKDTMLGGPLTEVRESRHHDGHGEECYRHRHGRDEECREHHHDHDEEYHEHHHDHDKECREHHHHGRDEECHEHHRDRDEECHEYHHHNHDGECHEHHHDHGEECHGYHHHDHDEGCHEHHRGHDEERHGHHHHDGCDHEHHHHHHADEVFTNWRMETIVSVTREQLEDILKRLSSTREFGDVLRAKGMFPAENSGEWLYFGLVSEQYEIRQDRPDYTGKICVIGANLKEEELDSVFGRGWLDKRK